MEAAIGTNRRLEDGAHLGFGAAIVLRRTHLKRAMRFLREVSDGYSNYDSTFGKLIATLSR